MDHTRIVQWQIEGFYQSVSLLQLWPVQNGSRVAVFQVGKGCRYIFSLLYRTMMYIWYVVGVICNVQVADGSSRCDHGFEVR